MAYTRTAIMKVIFIAIGLLPGIILFVSGDPTASESDPNRIGGGTRRGGHKTASTSYTKVRGSRARSREMQTAGVSNPKGCANKLSSGRGGANGVSKGCPPPSTPATLTSAPVPVPSPALNVLVSAGDDGTPGGVFPLPECSGDCDQDTDCEGDLLCFYRDAFTSEPIPGCIGSGTPGQDYCYAPITYKPGEATVLENGLLLSTGLTARIIARTNQKVQYDDGGQSSENFHRAPDGGAVFLDDATEDYVYVSNAESNLDGGVGAIRFNSQGGVIGYKRLVFEDPITGVVSKDRTIRNCGGGKTYWGTWITCEEWDDGQVWEIDPWGNSPGRQTVMGGTGRAYESAAYDNRNANLPLFYVTVDETNGPLVRFTPEPTAASAAVSSGNYSQLLHTPGTFEYFEVISIGPDGFGAHTGTYRWTTDVSAGNDSASQYHVQGEGIDIRDGEMFYTTKAGRFLFVIDLDGDTFVRSSTSSGAFDSQPDQIARVLDFTSGNTDGILYFCEDGGDNCGVHGRDAQGRFFTILQDETGSLSGETTGLAFSPDSLRMYVSYQKPGYIYEIKRLDGFPFYGATLDIKYHNDADNSNVFGGGRMLFEDNAKTCDTNSETCIV